MSKGARLVLIGAAAAIMVCCGVIGVVFIGAARRVESWHNASTGPLTYGSARVDIERASLVGPLPFLRAFAGEATGPDEKLLSIHLTISNVSEAKIIKYSGWSSRGVVVEDNFGNRLTERVFDALYQPRDQKVIEDIYPKKSCRDVVVFKPPVAGFSYVRLRLPAKNVGEEGYICIEIPATMVAQ